ncbi:PAS domain-containing protein [Methylobacterium sp. W2]|uniref:PAS domain-containing protein n=1 Tax=Methylobacterium sp. W2 TaxID=2598107 RepID=UPI001D0C4E83|nr:PAS domain-containing protein [Methylobacterium sp. W2]
MPPRSPMDPSGRSDGASRRLPSRRLLKLMEHATDVGFWSADLEELDIYGSIGLHRVLGLPPSVALSFGVVEAMMHPDDRAAHTDMLTLLRGGQPLRREFRIIRPDQTLRWIASHAEVVLGPGNRPSQAIGVVEDVTDRYDAKHSTKQGPDRFKALLSATAAVVWIVSPDGKSIDMPLWEELTGQRHEQFQGLGWIDVLHSDDRERTNFAWRTALSHDTAYNTDYRILCVDGVYRWFNARGVPIMNRDGSVKEWVGVCLSVPGQSRFQAASSSTDARGPATDIGRSVGDLTSAQVRAARGMTGLSKDELARRASVSVSTIVRIEDPDATIRPRRDTVQAVRQVLEQAGVVFTFDPGHKPGVREA